MELEKLKEEDFNGSEALYCLIYSSKKDIIYYDEYVKLIVDLKRFTEDYTSNAIVTKDLSGLYVSDYDHDSDFPSSLYYINGNEVYRIKFTRKDVRDRNNINVIARYIYDYTVNSYDMDFEEYFALIVL